MCFDDAVIYDGSDSAAAAEFKYHELHFLFFPENFHLADGF